MIKVRDLQNLLNLSINISGVLLGFLITLKGILISIGNSRIIRLLKEAGVYGRINLNLRQAIIGNAILLGFSLVCNVVDFGALFPDRARIDKWLFAIWTILLSGLVVVSFSFIRDFLAVMHEADGE
jgi:hypothetical protein